jgi:short-subunit dehydrogenase
MVVHSRVEDSVAVITGASSGIGRATARAFARCGASLVLAARRRQPLEEAVRECTALGAKAIAEPVDVSNSDDVQRLSQRAIHAYGRADVWVNNAAVSLFSRLDEGPIEAHRRVIEINLLGYIYGARWAVGHFRERGRGVLVNVSSGAAYVGQPYTSAYVVSKFAIRGLGECLRQELVDLPDVHVCTILPGPTDTPLFQHAGNYTGRAVKPMPPVADAERVANAIIKAVVSPRREIFIGGGRMLPMVKTLAPRSIERLVGWMVRQLHFQSEPAPLSTGNLFEPMAEGADVSGGWR